MPFTQPPDRTGELFRHLFEEASLGIAVEDMNGTILHANPALCSLLGFSQDELRGMGCSQLAHPEDSKDDWALFQKLRAGEIDRYSIDKRYTRRDGTQIYGRLNVSLLKTGNEGNPLIFAFVEDITKRKRAEEALKKSEERFHLAAQAGRMFAYEWDVATDRITRSGPYAHVLGTDQTEQTSGAQIFSQVHPDDQERMIAAVALLSSEKPDLEIAYRMIRQDGKVLWVQRRSRAYFDEHGKLERIFGMVADITERKQADEAAKESEKRFRLMADMAPVLIWMSGTDKLCTYFNEQWLDFTGRSIEQELGNGWAEGVHPGDLPRCLEIYGQSFDRREKFEMEYRIRRHDGEYRWIFDIGVPRFNGDGSFAGYIGSCIDITERKNAEREMALANDRLLLAIESGGVGGWDGDLKSGKILWFGKAAALLGAEPNKFQGTMQEFWDRVHPGDRSRLRDSMSRAARNRKEFIEEFRVVWRDGKVNWLSSRGKYYYSATGEPERMLGISRDITDRRKMDEALRNSEAKFSAVFRRAPIAMAITRARDHRYLDVNHTFEQVTGWSRDEVIGRPTLDIGLWIDPAQRIEMVNRLLAGHRVRDIEIRYRRKNGTEGVGQGAADLIEIGDEQCILSVIADITDRKLAEEGRRVSEERLRLAVEAGGMYANEWSPATDQVIRSPEVVGILGSDEPLQTTRQMVLERILPDDRARFLAAISKLTPEKPTANVTYRILLPGGKVLWLKNSGRAFFDREGKMLRIIGMAADVTDQKAAEEALLDVSRKLVQAQDQERTRIARDLHDDIAQRLAFSVVGIEQLRQDAPRPKGEFRARIEQIRRQLLEVANDVQALSRELHSSKLEYLGLVVAARSVCKEFGKRYKVRIRFESSNMPGSIPLQSSISLFRVLQEALHNAAKHSEGKLFDVKLWGSSDEIHLTVEDKGVGFDVDAAMKGEGLGLTSMRERLRLVNGELVITSQQNSGTTVHARMPFSFTSKKAAG